VRATGATLAVVSGRSVASLLEVSGFAEIPGIVIYGTHGAERWEAGVLRAASPPPGLEQLRGQLPGLIAGLVREPDLWIEDKSLSLVVHGRLTAAPERVLERLREGPKVDPRLASLTPQERRILDLIAEGYTNRQIAETMFLAEKTVKNYVSNLLAKLGMERRTQAATFAARLNERSAQDARSDASGT
jgi:DNA-binding CsgD family transcriptional regulator